MATELGAEPIDRGIREDPHGATEALAAFACTPRAGCEPDARAEAVGRALVDTVGCALAASDSEPVRLLDRWCAGEAGSGPATGWASGRRLPTAQAALLNGTAAHALDWDDVSPAATMHPSTVLLPALLAVAETHRIGGPALVRAYQTGAAAFRALTHALPGRTHYQRGWHTTATVGRLAAASALVRLTELDQNRARHAFGLVASMAAGSLANFGTMTKPLHAGLAARDAVMAVALAADGFTANPEQLEAPDGFFAVYGEPAHHQGSLADGLEHWRDAWPTDWATKRYPCCYATHRAVDAALALRCRLAGSSPERVEVAVEPDGLRPLRRRRPATGTEAKFSMAYAVATALHRGVPLLSHFDDEAVRDEHVQRLMAAVVVTERDAAPGWDTAGAAGHATVTAFGRDGRGGTVRVTHTRGDARNPLTDGELDAKFADCCRASGLSPAGVARVAGALRALPRAGGFDLSEALAEVHHAMRTEGRRA